MNFTRIKRIII